MNFANQYRPTQFEDVVGQRQTVAVLSGLARRRTPRNILLSGAFGSGKTSMAKILARAWNCASPTALGSPCGSCDFCCGKYGKAMFECTVTTMAGDSKDICTILRDWHRTPTDYPVQTIFFDEAHGLKESGLDALLKATEEPVEGVCILFATTKPWLLSKTLKSRLFEVHVKALNQSDSMTLLRRIVAKAQLTADTDALLLLASLKRGHPRDLISGLEQVSLGADHITADAVKRCFDIDQENYLTAYFSALSTGDTSALSRIMREWKEPLAAKISWIRAYLLSIYQRDLLGHDVMVDPVVDTMRRLRPDIVRSFCERLQLDDPSELVPHWRRMLSFWFVPQSTDETLLRLRLTLFEDWVNGGFADEVVEEFSSPAILPRRNINNTVDHSTEVTSASVHAPVDEHASDGKYYFGSQDLALIVNRASFFAQHHGRYMNAWFEVTPAFAAMQDDGTAMAVITRFAHDLDRHVESRGEASAIITVFDKGASGVVGKLLAYVPDLGRGEGRVAALNAWCNQWTFEGDKGHHIKLTVAQGNSSLRFHWRAMALLAARMHDAIETRPDWSISLARRLLETLKAKPDESYIGPLPRPPVSFSDALSERAIDRACQFDMPLLSAIDDGAFGWLTNGWELLEYPERTNERLSRENDLRQIDETYDDPEERAAALESLESEWHKSAKSRPRKSTHWWWCRND